MKKELKKEIFRLKKLRKWKNNVEIWIIDIVIEIIKWIKYIDIKKIVTMLK